MKLQELVKPADLFFVKGSSLVSKGIQKITHSQLSHVGIIYDPNTTFETDIKWGRATFRKVDPYNKKQIIVVRPIDICSELHIQALCARYDKTPYSFWDICTNFILAPFKESTRRKVVEFLGTKRFAICSELTARIYYEATKFEYLRGYEGFTPQDLFSICLAHPQHFQVALDQVY